MWARNVSAVVPDAQAQLTTTTGLVGFSGRKFVHDQPKNDAISRG